MKKIYSFLLVLAVVVLVFSPALKTLAADTATDAPKYEATLIPGSAEHTVEILNLIAALLAAFYAIKLAALSQGGMMEKTWNMLAIVAVLFALLEINNTLEAVQLVAVHGLGELIEFIFSVLLFATFYKTRKQLLAQIFGKK